LILEGGRDMFLPDDVIERRGPPLAIQRLCHSVSLTCDRGELEIRDWRLTMRRGSISNL
jgi:hypothetical protein